MIIIHGIFSQFWFPVSFDFPLNDGCFGLLHFFVEELDFSLPTVPS